MGPTGSSSFIVPDRHLLSGERPELCPTVVWLRGEHDIATDGALCLTLARAIAHNDADLVLDLSEVELMCASTIGVIVAAREFLRQRLRTLTVRCPSLFVRRTIGICGLDDFIVPRPAEAEALPVNALGSWVAVPATEQPGRRTDVPAPSRVAQHVGQSADRALRAVKAERMADIA